jgi:carbamoyltransferase
MRILGINCLNHDAAMAVVEDGEILWAAHAERYSKDKNDHYLNWQIVNEAREYGPWDKVVYYERPLLKKLDKPMLVNGMKFFLEQIYHKII